MTAEEDSKLDRIAEAQARMEGRFGESLDHHTAMLGELRETARDLLRGREEDRQRLRAAESRLDALDGDRDDGRAGQRADEQRRATWLSNLAAAVTGGLMVWAAQAMGLMGWRTK